MTVLTNSPYPDDLMVNEVVPPTRHTTMAGAMALLRTSRGGGFPLSKVLLTIGAICVPTGIILIIVGWYGSAHTLSLYEQNDYLISGGILGSALVVVGGFLYFGYWMTRQLQVVTIAAQQAMRGINQLRIEVSQIASSTAVAAAALTAASEVSAGGGVAAPIRTVATERGKLAHRPDCPVVANKDNLKQVDLADPAYRPCQICLADQPQPDRLVRPARSG